MKDRDDIAELASTLRANNQEREARWLRLDDLYEGNLTVPLSELYQNEEASVANLMQSLVDGGAQRLASSRAQITWHATKPGFKQHEETARKRRQVSYGWWDNNDMQLIDFRRYRHLLAYAESPVQLRWDRQRNLPVWDVRDPKHTFVSPMRRMDDYTPLWALFCYSRPLAWVKTRWPDAFYALAKNQDKDRGLVDIIEYQDAEETVLLATATSTNGGVPGKTEAVELERVPNRCGRCLVVNPSLVTLTGKSIGRADGMVPKYIRRARLDALQLIAIEDGIFPKQYIVGRENEVPKVLRPAKPREGQIGYITGGTLDTVTQNPGYKTDQAIRDLERAEMIEGGMTAASLGEGIRGARTGRLSDSIQDEATQFDMFEAHQVMALSKRYELQLAAEMAKKYASNVSVSMYVSSKGAKGPVSYKAGELFDEDCSLTVEFPMPGTDLNQQTVRWGQKQALGAISLQTLREKDPEIDDAELEKDRTTAEAIHQAVLLSVQTGAQTPDGPYTPEQLARIAELVITNRMELFEAIIKVQKEAQEAQAALPPAVPEGMAAAPETMPGLMAPSAPAPPTGPPPLEDLLAQAIG